MKKLLNNKEIRKLILGVVVVTISIYLVFFGLFALMGETMNRLQINQLHNAIIHVEEMKWEDNGRDNTIAVIEAEIEKMEFIAELKTEIEFILYDRRFFDVNRIDEEHLYFMESQRAHYEIPKQIYYRLIFMESGFRMFDSDGEIIRSSAGAMGYMQMLNSTFNDIIRRYDLEGIYDITNPYHNIMAGTFYLHQRKRDMERIFPNTSDINQWKFALSAYNAGIGKVVEARGIPNIDETINYVSFIMRNFMYENMYADIITKHNNI